MNLPNKLTILRMIMIPVFLVVLYIPGLGMAGNIAAAAIFILASITDFLDGKIARKYNLVTNFGKFMDPLADKLLVCSALIALVDFDKVAAWIVIIIIAREFIISGFRLIAADNGVGRKALRSAPAPATMLPRLLAAALWATASATSRWEPPVPCSSPAAPLVWTSRTPCTALTMQTAATT